MLSTVVETLVLESAVLRAKRELVGSVKRFQMEVRPRVNFIGDSKHLLKPDPMIPSGGRWIQTVCYFTIYNENCLFQLNETVCLIGINCIQFT